MKGRISGIRIKVDANENTSLAQSMMETIKIAYEKFDTIQAECKRLYTTELEFKYRSEVDILLLDEIKNVSISR